MAKISSEKIVFNFVEKIINKIGLKADLKVKEENDVVNVIINGDNLGALIGFHGETLESLQLIATLVLNREVKGEVWKRVVVDIGNWRAERTSALANLIEKSIKEMTEQKLEKLTLPAMSSSQRREIHLIVSEKFPDFASESEGQDPNRCIILYKKT